MRRPAAACAAGFAAGIAIYSAAGWICILTAGIGFLLLFLHHKWNIIEKFELNSNYENQRINAADYQSGDLRGEDDDRQIRDGTIPDREQNADGTEERRLRLMTASSLKKAAVFFLLFFIAGSFRYAVFDMKTSSFAGRSGETEEITGIVLSEEVRSDKRVLEISADGEVIFRERILVTLKDTQMKQEVCLTGMRVTVRGILREPESQGNPGVFDYRRYLESCGIQMTMQADIGDLSVCDDPGGIYMTLNILERFRRSYLRAASEIMNEEAAGLLAGIMFGDRTKMNEEIYGEFQKNGTAHLLAVSGLHISMIYSLFAALLGNAGKVTRSLFSAAVLILYAALSGFSPSVVRAVFMILTQLAARMINRRYDGLSGISFCAFSLLMYRPSMLFSSGFQLSFLAVLTISVVMSGAGENGKDIRQKRKKEDGNKRWKEGIKEQAKGVFLMQAGMMPVTLHQFHYISPAAFLLNPPAIALAGFIVPAGVVMMPFSAAASLEFLPDFLRTIADEVFGLFCMTEEMLLSLLTFLNELPEGTVFDYRYMASPPSGVFLFYYAALFFFFSEAGRDFMHDRKGRLKRAVSILLIFASVSCCAGLYADRAGISGDLVFLDVGQGDCAHLKDGNTHLLFDSGGSDTYDVGENILLPYFLSNGVSEIDLAVISHLHTDHCGGLISLMKGVKIEKMMLSAVYESQAGEISELYGIPQEDLLFVRQGDRVAAGDVVLDILAPAPAGEEEYRRILADSQDENELCLIVKAEYKGGSALFTGDIGEEYEKFLASRCGEQLKADILKVAHHGSRYSTCESFISAVSPGAAVIQVGTNYYGHPSAEAIGRLEDAGVSVFRNDRDGAVFADMKSGKMISMREYQRVFFRN